jgi:uncharacterized protein DUF2752
MEWLSTNPTHRATITPGMGTGIAPAGSPAKMGCPPQLPGLLSQVILPGARIEANRIELGHAHPWPGRLSLAIMALVCVPTGLLLFFFDPDRYGFYPRCMFHSMTGLLCPGCGSLRAMHQLLHGHIAAALHLNALFVLSLPALGWLSCDWLWRRLRGRPTKGLAGSGWLWAALVLTVVFAIARNLPFARLIWLAP